LLIFTSSLAFLNLSLNYILRFLLNFKPTHTQTVAAFLQLDDVTCVYTDTYKELRLTAAAAPASNNNSAAAVAAMGWAAANASSTPAAPHTATTPSAAVDSPGGHPSGKDISPT
jgi:hypothetical protein